MKIYILEVYDAEEPIISQTELTHEDLENTASLTIWLNKHIVNKYLVDENGQDYKIEENEFGRQYFTDIGLSLFKSFIFFTKRQVDSVYIYGDYPTFYKFFTKIPKVD
jgi:hypothetical protein